MEDVVFRNYTRMMTRSKKLYFQGFPFPVPIAETAGALAGIYVYWRFIMPAIPDWIPLLGTSQPFQLVLGILIAIAAFMLVKIRGADGRPLIFSLAGRLNARFGSKISNPRTGKKLTGRPLVAARGAMEHA